VLETYNEAIVNAKRTADEIVRSVLHEIPPTSHIVELERLMTVIRTTIRQHPQLCEACDPELQGLQEAVQRAIMTADAWTLELAHRLETQISEVRVRQTYGVSTSLIR
jgi:hypothetical protein